MEGGKLLEQIQLEAVNSSLPLSDLLRKCRILAQRLGHEPLKQWVHHELNGYPDKHNLPKYRNLYPVIVRSHYMGDFNSEIKNLEIPQTAVDEKMRKILFTLNLTASVSEVECLVSGSEDDSVSWHVPPEMTHFIHDRSLREDYVLVRVWRVISIASLEKILSIVRNKVLDFTLELESEVERTGAPIQNLNRQEPEKVQHIFNTNIHAPVGNLAQGNRDVSQSATVDSGDLSSLKNALQELGLPEELEAEILEAVEQEQPEDNTLPARVSDLVGKVVSQAAQGALKVSGTAAAQMLTEALNGYFGF